MKITIAPDGVSASKIALATAIEVLRPLLDLPLDGTAASGEAEEKAEKKSVASETFKDIETQKEYIRPNGVAYRPRTMTIADQKVHDVTFIRASAAKGLSVLLYGPPGTGKTALVEAALPNCLTVQGTIETETADFVGSWVQDSDGTYRWVDGPLVVAADEGRPLLIDEIALIDPRSLAVVYGAMDGRNEIVVTQNPKRGVVKVKHGFIVMGAFNPNVPGAVLSDALVSRFPVQIEVGTDWSLASQLGCPTKLIQIARNLNEKARNGLFSGSAPQLRELLAYRDIASTYGDDVALRNFVGQIRPENRDVALEIIASVLGSKPTPFTL